MCLGFVKNVHGGVFAICAFNIELHIHSHVSEQIGNTFTFSSYLVILMNQFFI